MNLALRSAELGRIDSCMRAMLDPLDYPDVERWRLAVNRQLRLLLDADTALFIDAASDAMPCLSSEELNQDDRATYLSFGLTDPGMERWRAMGGPAAANQAMVVGDDWAGYHADPMVNVFYKPRRLLDCAALAVYWPEDGAMAMVELHAAEHLTPRFGASGIAKLQIVAPAFEAGLRMLCRTSAQQAEFARLLDTLGDGIIILHRDGRVLHENPALGEMLAADPERDDIRASVARVAAAVCSHLRAYRPEPLARIARLEEEVVTGLARYRIRTTFAGSDLATLGGAVLVMVERLTPAMPGERDLVDRYGLSRREAAVALLLARGATNQAIAAQLGISEHTTRHHTERVLMKLGIHSRAEVAARLTRRPS